MIESKAAHTYKVKTLNKVFSYISGSIVEKRTSRISGELEVWYQNGKYVLHSPEANYSYDTLHRVFQRAFIKLNVKKRNPKNALILGFGAGSVATILCDELLLTPTLTGIEADQEVIHLAYTYFNLQRFSNLSLQISDAAEFLQSCTKQFELVVSDVFVDKHIPKEVLTDAYLENLVRCTARNGMGMINAIAETKDQRKQVEGIMKKIKQTGMRTVSIQASPINVIISWEV